MRIQIVRDDATLEHVRLKKGDVLEVDDDLAIHWRQNGICVEYIEPPKIVAKAKAKELKE